MWYKNYVMDYTNVYKPILQITWCIVMMKKIPGMKLETLIHLFSELEDGRTLAECQKSIENNFAVGFMYIKSSSLKDDGVFRLVPDPKSGRRKLIRLTARGKRLKALFAMIAEQVGRGGLG